MSKTFTKGQDVEVQREPNARWERATYRERWTATPSGRHVVDTSPDTYLIVPSRRIRATAD